MENTKRDQVLSYLQQRIAEIDTMLMDLQRMEEFIDLGYIDLKSIPVAHNSGYQDFSGQFNAWVTPQCQSGKRQEAEDIVQKLENRNLKMNTYFKTSTPITGELFFNICKAVGNALQESKTSLEGAYKLLA